MRDDNDIAENYSSKLEDIFLAAKHPDSVTTMHEVIANETFLALISQRNQCKKRQDWNNLNIQVKQMRDKLKNDYYRMKAKSINEASEARNVEEQFRLAKQYSALSNSNRLLTKPQLLTDHFKVHFSERMVVMQPEVNKPYILSTHIIT